MQTSAAEFELSISSGVRLNLTGDALRITAPGFEVRLGAAAPALMEALARLADGGATESQICEELLRRGDSGALFSFYGVLRSLDAGGHLRRILRVGARPFASLTPLAAGSLFDSELPPVSATWKLSRFAYVHAVGGGLRLESPLGCARVDLHDPFGAAVTAALAEPKSADELAALFPDLAGWPLLGLLTLLRNAQALIRGDDLERPGPEQTSASWWEFHDLLFHMRSRLGRHDSPYGGTSRLADQVPPALTRPRGPGATTPLPRPDLEHLRRTDPPFTDVLERRRSVRRYGEEPVSLEQLGEFLYRTARYQAIIPGRETQLAFRPSPSGGALQELELYPIVARCRGLEPGVYRYDPSHHDLTRIESPPDLVALLLEQAWVTGNRGSPLNVCFGITARCRRVFWKYESMGYALILKNLGALYATMYLVATAMGLAPCGLGGGDSELFSRVAGLDPYEEPEVGEFLLGSREDTSR